MATTTQRGLGKGLSALISENYVQPPKAPENASSGTYTLAVASLHAGKYQPRSQFDEGMLLELAESIRKNGVVQPIIVRPSKAQAGKYEIIAGERRWRAAKMAGFKEIPVLIREVADQQALELALVENVQRQDLSPIDEANGYKQLIEEFEYTQDALAEAVGKSRSHIANFLRLLSLPDEIKQMMNKGELTMGHARALLNAPNAVELARDIVKQKLTVRQAEEMGQEAQGRKKKSEPKAAYASPPAKVKDPDIVALEETLSENLGLKVSINDRGKSGEIVIAYDSLSQLDEILRRLGGGI